MNGEIPLPASTLLLNPVVHRQQPDFVNALLLACGGNLTPVKEKRFMDDMPYLRIGAEPNSTVVIPAVLAGAFESDFMRLLATINAAKHYEGIIESISGRVIVVCSYFEGRSDHLSQIKREEADDDWVVPADDETVYLPGEAIYVELMAKTLGALGVDDLIIMDIHSLEGLNYLKRNIPRVHHLTAFPLFAKRVTERGLVSNNTRVFGPDRGSLARVELLANLLDLPVVRGTKYRPAHNQAEVTILDGKDLKGATLLTGDEVIDTFGTVRSGLKILKEEFEVEQIHVFSTSGKFSGPAIARIRDAFEAGLIDSLTVTNTLPSARMIEALASRYPVEVIDVIPVFAEALHYVLSLESLSEFSSNDHDAIKDYLFDPDPPDIVEARLDGQTGAYSSISTFSVV